MTNSHLHRLSEGGVRKPGAKPMYGGMMWADEDVLNHWKITLIHNLVLKNNSSTTAYHIHFENIAECFDEFELPQKMFSLVSNESKEFNVKFIRYLDAKTGQEADNFPLIPLEKERQKLIITYKNEAGTQFITNFYISLTHPENEYIIG